MNVLDTINQRLSNEENKLHKNQFINKKGIGIPFQWTVDLSIKELTELSNCTQINKQQKEVFKKKVKSYYKSEEMFGKGRTLLQIDKQGNVIIWID